MGKITTDEQTDVLIQRIIAEHNFGSAAEVVRQAIPKFEKFLEKYNEVSA